MLKKGVYHRQQKSKCFITNNATTIYDNDADDGDKF